MRLDRDPIDPEVAAWKERLRDLRKAIAAAPDAALVEEAWTEWDAGFDTVPPEVTTKAKELVDARLYALKNG